MKKKSLYITIIVILILAIVGVGQYMYFENTLKEQGSAKQPIVVGEAKEDVNPVQKIDQDIMSKVNNLLYNTGNPNDVWAINKEIPSVATIKQEYDNAKKVSNSVVGWIWVQGTNINYPIAYNKNDDNYYLIHNYRNDKWWNGAIFRDSANTYWGQTVLVNGHNMLNAVMFAQLMNFRDPTFYKANKYIEIYNGKEAETYKIVGAFYAEPTQHFKLDQKTDEEKLAYYKEMQAKSIYGVEPVTTAKTLFLNTCLSDGTGRHLILMSQEVK